MRAPALKRVMQTLSREMEFFTVDNLRKQTGQPEERWWPEYCCKELVDNAIDAAEQTAAVPVIEVKLTADWLEVKDNGPGIKLRDVLKTLNFQTSTSDKMSYASPSRGSQGNGLKTILAIPYVQGKEPVTIGVRAQGWHHHIEISTNQVKQVPVITPSREPIVKTEGSAFLVPAGSARSKPLKECLENITALMLDFALFNPHCTFILNGKTQAGQAGLSKWTMQKHTCAHWYDLDRFKAYAAMLLVDDEGREEAKQRTVREFILEFAGFQGTLKNAEICERLGLQGPLASLAPGDVFDDKIMEHLLAALKVGSKPIKPKYLGVLGEERFKAFMAGPEMGDSFRYRKLMGTDYHGLPYIVEAAFAKVRPALRGLHYGINFSVPIGAALASTTFSNPGEDAEDSGTYYEQEGLAALLAHHRVNLKADPVCLALHIVCPRIEFLDKGKSNVRLPEEQARAVRIAVDYATWEWAKHKRQLERGRARAERPVPAPRAIENTVMDSFYAIAQEAYDRASGNGKFRPYNRQIYYQARKLIQQYTDKVFTFGYFGGLLKDFQRDFPEKTKGWRVYYKPRGTMIEPHTGRHVLVGTLEVEQYLVTLAARDADPTRGPGYHFGSVLYVEKEGLSDQITGSGLQLRYDLALVFGEGFATDAARDLLGRMAGLVRLFVLHDFDVGGLSIARTLHENTPHYQHKAELEVIDLGLRLTDVERLGLDSESVHYDKKGGDPRVSLRLCKATAEEIGFLVTHSDGGGGFYGDRVELNALSAPELIAYLEAKLQEHGVQKLIPPDSMLEALYREHRLLRLQAEAEEAAEEEKQEIEDELWAPFNKKHSQEMSKISAAVLDAQDRVHVREVEPDVPDDLHDRVAEHFEEHPEVLWTEAVEAIEDDEPVEEDTEPVIDEPEPPKPMKPKKRARGK